MKRTMIALAFAGALASATVSADPAPGVGFSKLNPANGHRYEIVEGTRDGAEFAGREKNGHLVTINDAAEWQWLISQFQMDYPQQMSTGVSTVAAYWIGLDDTLEEGVFRWTSGELLSSTVFGAAYTSPPWAPLEPSNSTGDGRAEDLVGMNFRICDFAEDYAGCTEFQNADDPGLWNDYGDGEFLTYGIIEYPAPQFALDPRASYVLAGVGDTPAAPLVIDLAAQGIAPGNLLRIARNGDFAYGPPPDFSDVVIEAIAVFSASAIVLDASSPNRVPDAIEAGTDFTTQPACSDNAVTDIPQDFPVFRDAVLTVPAGATYLIVGIDDCYIEDNVDPDGDLGVTLTAYTGVTVATNVSIGFNPVMGAGTTLDQRVSIGDFANLGDSVQLRQGAQLGDLVTIGNGTIVNRDSAIGSNVSIGSNGVIARNVVIEDNVTIGDAVRIGQGSVICAGATIGAGATLGQNALVGPSVSVPAGVTLRGSRTSVSPAMCTGP